MAMPTKLQKIIDLFASVPVPARLEGLLEYAEKLPPLPPHLEANRDAMEPVPECQTPFFLAAEVSDGVVILYFDAPRTSPTTRGFAGVLTEGLNGSRVDEVLAVPADFYTRMGLEEAISTLRLRGVGAILARLKRQVEEKAAASAR
jgi:cysteine desulfuration protein SufE